MAARPPRSMCRPGYRTADGWIAVTLMREEQYVRLCGALGRGDMASEARYRDFAARAVHAADLRATLVPIFASRTTEDWLQRLREADVMATAVLDYAQWLADPHVKAVGAAVPVVQPGFGELPVPGIPGVAPVDAADPRAIAPDIGADSLSILREVGCAPDEIRALQDAGVVVAAPAAFG